uniref:Acetyl-CoA acetyltransferase n=1 Tax=Hirondellea gigas TaxID=1518452 RepID=A0A6A7GG14_9CRUS
MSGVQDVVIAGGVESMSVVPIGASVRDGLKEGHGHPQSSGIKENYKNTLFSQFDGAEITAKTFGVSRAEMDSFGYASHVKAKKATESGYFKNEIIPIAGKDRKTGAEVVHEVDEGIRFTNLSLAKMEKLPSLRKGGLITAATSSQICDGAAALLFCNEAGLAKLGVKPRARIVSLALAGTDPIMMLSGPIPASKTVLKRAGLTIDQIDIYEVNEAFASVPLAWAKELKADLNKLNVNGGAMALGHPLGGTGAKLMTTLVNELERRKGKYGLQAICEGGGTANATIIERIDGDTYNLSKL